MNARGAGRSRIPMQNKLTRIGSARASEARIRGRAAWNHQTGYVGGLTEYDDAWSGMTIFGKKRPCIGNLPKRPKMSSLSRKLLELAAACEEVGNNIEDRLIGG